MGVGLLASAGRRSRATVTVPGAPTQVNATAGDTQATVTYSPPASNGGSTILEYRVTRTPGGQTTLDSGGSPTIVTGLTNGTAYTFTVAARNAIGWGAESAASNSVTPQATATPLFDGSTRASWALRQASTPSSGTSSTLPTANGSDIIQTTTDPLGVFPDGVPVLRMHVTEDDRFDNYVRIQAVSSDMMTIDGSHIYWMRRVIGFPANYPTMDASGSWMTIGSFSGPPYSGTSSLPMQMIISGGQNAFDLVNWSTTWTRTATKGVWHKMAMRVRTSTSAATGWVEMYYAPWGQPMTLQTLTGTANLSGGQLVNNNTRINGLTVPSGQDDGLNNFRIQQYRKSPQANFSGFNDVYYAYSALYDDADVSSVAAIDPEF